MKFHQDMGRSDEMMKHLNDEWGYLRKHNDNIHETKQWQYLRRLAAGLLRRGYRKVYRHHLAAHQD